MRSYSVIISLLLLLISCTSEKKNQIEGYTFSGKTQGTTYTIIIAEENINFKQNEIDKLLANFDTIFSTYISESHITKINNVSDEYSFIDRDSIFIKCYDLAQEAFNQSGGLYDPSVYSLVKGWGFFDKSETVLTDKEIDSILQFTNFKKGLFHNVEFIKDSIRIIKNDPRFKLDFNGIAQGYSVDVVADFIEKKGHKNYYIEIGGEIRVKGKNKNNGNWNIGIDTPSEENTADEREIITTISVTNCGIATSGNYRNFFVKDGIKYGHTLNPKTGKPILTDVISATVITQNAALADAYATVFMILGKEKSIEFVNQQSEMKIILIYRNDENELKVYRS